jgi:hypothetical protein
MGSLAVPAMIMPPTFPQAFYGLLEIFKGIFGFSISKLNAWNHEIPSACCEYSLIEDFNESCSCSDRRG